MSQEEDKQKSCSAGKVFAGGLAVTALGVGVGAALYYFLGRDNENQQEEPSTSWHAEQNFTSDEDSDSYTTLSVNTTTDTSVHNSSSERLSLDSNSITTLNTSSDTSGHTTDLDSIHFDESDSDSDADINVDSDSDADIDVDSDIETISSASVESVSDSEMDYNVEIEGSLSSVSDDDGWHVTHTISHPTKVRSIVMTYENLPTRVVRRFASFLRNRNKSRKRAYTLEECAVCFEVMLVDQNLMSLPCTHNFHMKCINPWLEQHQTCPVCRQKAD